LPPIAQKILNNKRNSEDLKKPMPGCSWQKDIFHIQHLPNKSESQTTRYSELKECLRMEHLNKEEKEHVQTLVKRHKNLFKLPSEPLTLTDKITHKINTTDNTPINVKQYRFPPVHKEEIDKQINNLMNEKIIVESNSPYNSPLWIVPKKPDSHGNKRWRMVIDYRDLNEKTIGDAYSLPNISEILDQLGSAKYFSIFDLASGFHQIPMNSVPTFNGSNSNRFVGKRIFVYLDDIVLYASSLREHEIKFNRKQI
jgi:hypothetical protein